MMPYIIKTLLTVIVVIAASEAAKRLPTTGALIASLPLVSMLVLCMLYYDTRDTAKVAEYARSVPPLVIPSIAFFYALVWCIQSGMGVVVSMLLATLLMLGGYGAFLFFARS